MRRSDSWVEIAIYALWGVSLILLIAFVYVVVHFLRKFW